MTASASHLAVPVGPEDHVRGRDEAALTVLEYGDYQCPFCGRAFPVVQALETRFGDDLRLIFRNLPLANVHPYAEAAAEMAEAMGLQGKFWEMHDSLFEHQRDLSQPALLQYAAVAGADMDALAAALDSGQPRARVRNDLRGAIRSGANGTPTFFVNDQRYDHSWALEPFSEYLQAILDRSKTP